MYVSQIPSLTYLRTYELLLYYTELLSFIFRYVFYLDDFILVVFSCSSSSSSSEEEEEEDRIWMGFGWDLDRI